MEKLKDFLYDKNDILVALIIVVVASLIISGRINAIMSYPGTLAKGESQGNVIESDLTANQADTKASGSSKDKDSNVIEGAPDSSDTAKKSEKPKFNHSLYVEYGSSVSKIADDLVKGGLVKSKEEFLNAVTALNADSKLKAGNFIIPDGSTPEEIVKIIIS